jgi:hypothetical protein
MFLFKKKKIVLDCFTTDSFAHEYAPISRATDFYPEWWNNIDNTYMLNTSIISTMKHCRGFIDLYKDSIIIPFWGKLKIDISDNIRKNVKWECNYEIYTKQPIQVHNELEYKGFTNNCYQHMKIISPWKCRTNKYVKFILTDPLYNRTDLNEYSVLPGVVDFKYQTSTHVNIMTEYKNDDRFIIFDPLTPMAMLTPISEENIIIKTHLIDFSEYQNLDKLHRLIAQFDPLKKYSKTKMFLNEHENRNKPKCPFGFGK